MSVRRRLLLGAATSALGAVLLAGLLNAPSSSTAAEDYPTWDEVQAAQGDAERTAAEISRIDGLLTGLEQSAARLGDASVQAAATYSAAATALSQAEATVANLQSSAASAAAEAEVSRKQAGATASSLARMADPTSELFFSGDAGDDILYRLGTLSRLGGAADDALAKAEADRKQAEALAAQATAAKAVRDRLAADAESEADAAAAAKAAADAQVADAQQQSDTLYAQLASLKQTSADLEAQYRQGLAAEQSYAEQNGSAGDGTADELAAVGAGGGSLSAGDAQSYASGRLSAFGWDSSQFSCLVSLWNRESGWRWNAYNASSGAYGIPQSLPGSKMASAGSDWQTSAATQIEWGLGYIRSSYGSPCAAWSHSESTGWY